jgi:nitroreductase
MNFLDLVKSRQSVRSYSESPVESEKLTRCLEAARLSPSACNAQPWNFYVIDDPELKEKIAQATFDNVVTFNRFALKAPVIVVITANKGNLKTKIGQMITKIPYYLIDIGIAAEHFCLQASGEGLGTCMIGWFKEKELRKHLKLSSQERVALLLTVGYPVSHNIREKKRKSLNEISRFNLDKQNEEY